MKMKLFFQALLANKKTNYLIFLKNLISKNKAIIHFQIKQMKI